MESNVILDGAAAGLNQRRLQEFVKRACRAVGLRGSVSLLLTSNRQMRTLNSTFRGKNRATDVLSFPAPPSASGFAGDIAISFETAARNARTLGHSIASEIEILVLHGILHLAGYDHESDHGEMDRRERQLRSKLALPTALIERNSPHIRRRAART